MLGFYPAGKTPHLIKRCEVRQMDAVWLTVTEATDFLEHLFPAVGIAPVQENRRPRAPQDRGRPAARARRSSR
jgi:hypothetical protein